MAIFVSTSILYRLWVGKASDGVSTSHKTETTLVHVSVLANMCDFVIFITRRNSKPWLNNGLHNMLCNSRECYIDEVNVICANYAMAQLLTNHT